MDEKDEKQFVPFPEFEEDEYEEILVGYRGSFAGDSGIIYYSDEVEEELHYPRVKDEY